MPPFRRSAFILYTGYITINKKVRQLRFPVARPSEANIYYFDGTSLIFKDGLLVNAASIHNAGNRTLRNILFDLDKLKHVIAVYGTPNATKTGGPMVRWYEVEGKVLVFESSTNLSSAYYISQLT
jgi:hypothetical protein